MTDGVMKSADSPSRKTIEQLSEEFMDRLRRGDRPSISEYVQNHASLADEIRDVFPALAMLEQLGSPASDPARRATNDSRIEQLGEYRILREVGRGGMGVVYEAVQEPLGRHVALKVLSLHLAGDLVFLERFGREARAAACLHHTNIVPVFDVGEHDGIHFYTMQFIQGQGLDQVIAEVACLRKESAERDRASQERSRRIAVSRRVAQSLLSGRFDQVAQESADELGTESVQRTHGPFDSRFTNQSGRLDLESPEETFPVRGVAGDRESTVPLPGQSTLSESSSGGQHFYRSVARVGLQVAEALEYMHSQGLLHRDIKPSNLLLDTHGVVWITDLGLARADESAALTRTGDVVGTVRYMAPERFRGESAPCSDLYSLGMTLYELLASRPAYDEADRGRLIYEINSKDPATPRMYDPRVPRDLETIVLKAIDREPVRRYQSAGELAADLRNYLDDRPIRARRSGVLERGWRWCRRNRLVASLAASLAALLIVAAAAGSIAAFVFRDQANDLRQEQTKSTQRLFDALIARAQSERWGGRMGQRFGSLRALTEAASLGPALHWNEDQQLQLRNEAIACMTLPDLRLAQPVHRLPPETISLAYDSTLERYVASDSKGNLHLFRTSDHVKLAQLPGAGDRAYVARFSGDGRLLAAKYHGAKPPVARVWDIAAKKVVLESAGGEFDFSPDGSRFALVTPDGAIQLFDLHSRQALQRVAVEPPCDVVRFHPDGHSLAVCNTRSSAVRVIDIESKKVVKTFEHPREVMFLNWDLTGKLLACACSDSFGYVWDVQSGEKQAVLRGHRAEVNGVFFGHRGPLLASVSWDKTTRLWDDRTGRQLISADGELLAVSADDRRLALRNQTGFISDEARVFEFASGDECRTLHEVAAQEKGPDRVDISPENRLLLSSGPDGARLWDLATAEQVAVLYENRQRLESDSTALFHPDGTSVLTNINDGVYRWPINRFSDEGCLHVTIGPPQQVSDLKGEGWASLDRTGRYLATVRGQGLVRLTYPDKSRITISPDGRWVACGTWHGMGVALSDAKTGRKVKDLFPEAASATVAFSPDGNWLSAGANDVYCLWKVGSWERRDIPGGAFPYLMAYSADGNTLAVSHSTSAVRLVDLRTGQTLADLEPQNPQMMSWLQFSPDGGRLAVACGSHVIQLWDLRRIRQQLSAMGLDWYGPSYPAAGGDADTPVRVEVDQGMLAPRSDSSQRVHAPAGDRLRVDAISKPRS